MLHIRLEPLLVNKQDAAKMLGVGPTVVNRLIAMGALDVIEIGRKTIRISVESIKRYITQHKKIG